MTNREILRAELIVRPARVGWKLYTGIRDEFLRDLDAGIYRPTLGWQLIPCEPHFRAKLEDGRTNLVELVRAGILYETVFPYRLGCGCCEYCGCDCEFEPNRPGLQNIRHHAAE